MSSKGVERAVVLRWLQVCPSLLLPAAGGCSSLAALYHICQSSTGALGMLRHRMPMFNTQTAPKWPHSPWGERKLWPFVKALIFPQGTGSNWSFMIKYILKFLFSIHLLQLMWKEKKVFSIKGYLCNDPVLNANSWITGSWQCCFFIFHSHFRT